MALFLLTWNPDYADVSFVASMVAERGSFGSDWSTASRKIRPTDDLLLLRQGVAPRGIVGVGQATGTPWQDADDGRHYVPLVWTHLEPGVPLLPLDYLERVIPAGFWRPRCSGVRVPEPIAEHVLGHVHGALAALA